MDEHVPTLPQRRLVIHATQQKYAVEMAILCGVFVQLAVKSFKIDVNENVMAIAIASCALYYFLLNTIQKWMLRHLYGHQPEDIVQVTL